MHVCDICGKDDDIGGDLHDTALLPAGDMMVCPACLLGFGEDNRSVCPRCKSQIPISYSLATWCDENIFLQTCLCGYVWDETVEGHNAPVWQLLLRLRPSLNTQDGG
jgi:hypothetical protein